MCTIQTHICLRRCARGPELSIIYGVQKLVLEGFSGSHEVQGADIHVGEDDVLKSRGVDALLQERGIVHKLDDKKVLA